MSYITHCQDVDYYGYPMIPKSEQKNYISTYKKTWESCYSLPHLKVFALPTIVRLSNAKPTL